LAFFKSKLVLGLITGFWFGFLKILIKKNMLAQGQAQHRELFFISGATHLHQQQHKSITKANNIQASAKAPAPNSSGSLGLTSSSI
jgi:hypothetical protein